MHSIVDMGCCIVGQVYGIQNCMTGHLLLEDLEFLCCILELLSGLQPVDISEPHSQENYITKASSAAASG
jgi:hypothetical protein